MISEAWTARQQPSLRFKVKSQEQTCLLSSGAFRKRALIKAMAYVWISWFELQKQNTSSRTHTLLWTVPSWWSCQENHQQILTHSPSPFPKYSLHGCFLKWPFLFWKHLSILVYVFNKDNLLKKTAQVCSMLGPNLCLTKPELIKLKKHTLFAEQSCCRVQENLFSFSVNQIQMYKHSKHILTLMQYFVCTIIWLNYCSLTKEYQSHSQTVLFHTFRIKRLEKKPNLLKTL